jgi:hypothetical protein
VDVLCAQGLIWGIMASVVVLLLQVRLHPTPHTTPAPPHKNVQPLTQTHTRTHTPTQISKLDIDSIGLLRLEEPGRKPHFRPKNNIYPNLLEHQRIKVL